VAGTSPGHDGVKTRPQLAYRCISMMRSIGIMLWFM
jgi:hypothetical protein